MATDTAQLVTDLQQAVYDLHDPCADEGTLERITETIKAAMGALVDQARCGADALATLERLVIERGNVVLHVLRDADGPVDPLTIMVCGCEEGRLLLNDVHGTGATLADAAALWRG